jgi:hypothetical protein
MRWNVGAGVLVATLLVLMWSPVFAGTWVPYVYDNSNAPKPVGNAEMMSCSAGATYTEGELKASVTRILLGLVGFSETEDGTATCEADCTVGLRVLRPCASFTYAWSGFCQIGEGSQITAEASASGVFTGAWGSTQGAYAVFGDLNMQGKAAVAVDDEGSGAEVTVGWPVGLKISSGTVTRTNNSDQAVFSGSDANHAIGTEVQVRYRGFSKVKGHAEYGNLGLPLAHASCECTSTVVTVTTLRGFRALGMIIPDVEIDVPVCTVIFSRDVTLYDCDSEESEPNPVEDLDEPPSAPEGRPEGAFDGPRDWPE